MGVSRSYYEYKPARVSLRAQDGDVYRYVLRDQYEEFNTEDITEYEYTGPRQSDKLWLCQEVEVETTAGIEEVIANFDAYWAAGDRESESDFSRLLVLEEKMDAVIALLLGGE